MDPASVSALEVLVSESRFAPYLDECGSNASQARRLYMWQASVASALWGPIAIFEVVLRNALHAQLSTRTGRADWWSDSSVRLLDREQKQIDDALKNANADAERRAKAGGTTFTPPMPGHVVAGSSLGLWVGLLSQGLPRDRLYSYETALWQPRLSRAFPLLGSKRRKQLHDECKRIQFVRNRVAHHEPLAPVETGNVCRYVEEIVGAIDADAATFLAGASRVAHILSRREAWRLGSAAYFL